MTTRPLLLCLLAACANAQPPNEPVGPTATGPTDGSSGSSGSTGESGPAQSRLTRLRMNGAPAAAGTDPEESWRFHDNTLDADCIFYQVNDDGDWRCVPRAFGSVRYKDADCKQPVLFFHDGCGAKVSLYATETLYRPDDPFHRIWSMRAELYKVGAEIAKPATVYTYSSWRDTCTEATELPKGDAFALSSDDGAELAHGTFEWKKGTSGRIGQARIVPDDAGSVADFMIGTAFDYAANYPCTTDTTGACTLALSKATIAYSDTQCQTEVMTLASTRELAKDPTGAIRRIATSSQSTVYDDATGMCEALPSKKRVVTFGETIVEAKGTLKTVGNGRIRDHRVEIDGLSFFAQHIDTQNGDAPCSPTTTSDGAVRCVPAGAWLQRAYTDSNCTQRVLAGDVDGDTPSYATLWEGCGTTGSTVVNVGAELSAPGLLYSKDSFGECNEIPDTDVDSLLDRYAVGSTVPPSTFGEMP